MTPEELDTFERIEIIQSYLRRWNRDLRDGLGISFARKRTVEEVLEMVKYSSYGNNTL